MMVAALYVDAKGCYSSIDGVDMWDITKDARLYDGPYPVVAHPPCQLWTRFAYVNYKRWGGEHNRPGNDEGCFEAALKVVRKWGGVLEHPAFSYAWSTFGLIKPEFGKWKGSETEWVTEVWQSAYGHKARKRTWLLYHGYKEPFSLRWEKVEASHQIGGHDQRGKVRNKPTISGRAASATPPDFRDMLIALAHRSTI